MHNELPIFLKCLHRLTHLLTFFLTWNQRYPCFREAGEPGRMLPSRTSAALQVVAHPVGLWSGTAFWEGYNASASITCSSCMRSISSGYSTFMFATSTGPSRIKGSSSRFPSRKLDRYQQNVRVARSSPSRSWVVYIMTTAEVHKRLHSGAISQMVKGALP